MRADARPGPGRRRLLGLGAAALLAASCQRYDAPGATTAAGTVDTAPTSAPRATVADWAASRGDRYVIAHRGAGDVYPEHSLPGYQAALDWGARCLEISVAITSDGQLICLHDLTYDRTTTGRGPVAGQPASVLDSIGIWAPQLGPAWLQAPLPRVPRLSEALDLVGGRAVLAIEAKDDRAYEPMLAMIARRGLTASVIVKAHHTSSRIGQASRAGLPVFGYLAASDMHPVVIAALAARLNPETDQLGIPVTTPSGAYWPDSLVAEAVGHGVPLWVYPAHRRSDADHYAALGVGGIVSSSYGYATGAVPVAVHDDWASGAITSGQISRDPASESAAPAWTGADELTLARGGAPQTVLLGQVCPVPATSRYRIRLDVAFPDLPSDAETGFLLAFARPDDRYYEPGMVTDGYDALISANGVVSLRRYDASTVPAVLGQARLRPVQASGRVAVSVQAGPAFLHLRVTAQDGQVAEMWALDATHRGGYLHVGRTGPDGSVSMRGLSVDTLTA